MRILLPCIGYLACLKGTDAPYVSPGHPGGVVSDRDSAKWLPGSQGRLGFPEWALLVHELSPVFSTLV